MLLFYCWNHINMTDKLFAEGAGAPEDPILGVGQQYKADPRAEKVNLSVGVKVKYSGPLYRDSNGGGQGKTVNGTYTVKYYYPGRKCGVHIDGLGWVPESGCTVIG